MREEGTLKRARVLFILFLLYYKREDLVCQEEAQPWCVQKSEICKDITGSAANKTIHGLLVLYSSG